MRLLITPETSPTLYRPRVVEFIRIDRDRVWYQTSRNIRNFTEMVSFIGMFYNLNVII
jgi:hypothetical protein